MTESNKKFGMIVGVIVVVLLVVIGGGNFLLNKIADRVILKLQKEYSPSSYGPGLDPDKVDLDGLKKKG